MVSERITDKCRESSVWEEGAILKFSDFRTSKELLSLDRGKVPLRSTVDASDSEFN